MEWLEDAPCRGLNPDIFFPPLDQTNHNAYYKAGKAVCHTCDVWEECLNYGMNETWGLWGGLTPQERRGTARLHHGVIEMYRFGCRCPKCRECSVTVRKKIPKEVFPARGQEFNIESLVFKLSSM